MENPGHSTTFQVSNPSSTTTQTIRHLSINSAPLPFPITSIALFADTFTREKPEQIICRRFEAIKSLDAFISSVWMTNSFWLFSGFSVHVEWVKWSVADFRNLSSQFGAVFRWSERGPSAPSESQFNAKLNPKVRDGASFDTDLLNPSHQSVREKCENVCAFLTNENNFHFSMILRPLFQRFVPHINSWVNVEGAKNASHTTARPKKRAWKWKLTTTSPGRSFSVAWKIY